MGLFKQDLAQVLIVTGYPGRRAGMTETGGVRSNRGQGPGDMLGCEGGGRMTIAVEGIMGLWDAAGRRVGRVGIYCLGPYRL